MNFPYKNPYFIGIKGSGMVGLTELLKAEHCKVHGSDVPEYFFTEDILKDMEVEIDSFAASLPKETDVVIYSAAYDENHPQRKEAKMKDIPQYSYPQALGLYAKEKRTISVVGTHGKTSTTAMLGFLLDGLGSSPTVLVGTAVESFNNHTVKVGKSDIFVVEACEYRRHFLEIPAQYILCTNVDYDHVDYFVNQEEYRKAFTELIEPINPNKLVSHKYCEFENGIHYGESESHSESYYLHGTRENGFQNITVSLFDQKFEYQLPFFGRHMIENFLGALTMAWVIAQEDGMDIFTFHIKTSGAIKEFQGVKRRMEFLREYKGALLFDDFAHHPKEIESTLEALHEAFPDRKLHVAFQSHTYTRTEKMDKEFAESLSLADKVYLAPIFSSARESKKNYSDEKFLSVVQEKNDDVFFGSFEEIAEELKKNASSEILICTMGAGHIYKVAESIA